LLPPEYKEVIHAGSESFHICLSFHEQDFTKVVHGFTKGSYGYALRVVHPNYGLRIPLISDM